MSINSNDSKPIIPEIVSTTDGLVVKKEIGIKGGLPRPDHDQDHIFSPRTEKRRYPVIISPGSFEPENHFYPKAVNANISSVVSNFLELGNKRVASRYCQY
jgi:hypothetical protein